MNGGRVSSVSLTPGEAFFCVWCALVGTASTALGPLAAAVTAALAAPSCWLVARRWDRW